MSNLKLTIGSVVIRGTRGQDQSPLALRRGLEAGLARGVADARLSNIRNGNVLQARLPTSASSNVGATISAAIIRALRKNV